MKTCPKCRELKPLDDFYKDRSNKDGHQGSCKRCQVAAIKAQVDTPERQERHKIASRKAAIKYRSSPKYAATRRRRTLKYEYGLSEDDYLKLLVRQGGVCAICGIPPSDGKVLFVDHDHNSRVVRGLLCNKCNIGLGGFEDRILVLEKAISYLENAYSSSAISLARER